MLNIVFTDLQQASLLATPTHRLTRSIAQFWSHDAFVIVRYQQLACSGQKQKSSLMTVRLMAQSIILFCVYHPLFYALVGYSWSGGLRQTTSAFISTNRRLLNMLFIGQSSIIRECKSEMVSRSSPSLPIDANHSGRHETRFTGW